MNPLILPIVVAIIGLAGAQGASAQQATVSGSGMNLSVAYPNGAGPAQQRSVGVVSGYGQNQSAEHVGPVEGGFGTTGFTAVMTGTGENLSVGYLRDAMPPVPQG